MHSVTDGQTDRQIERETETDRQTDRQQYDGRVNPTAYNELKIETDGLNN